jgi:hypothetical protein
MKNVRNVFSTIAIMLINADHTATYYILNFTIFLKPRKHINVQYNIIRAKFVVK